MLSQELFLSDRSRVLRSLCSGRFSIRSDEGLQCFFHTVPYGIFFELEDDSPCRGDDAQEGLSLCLLPTLKTERR